MTKKKALAGMLLILLIGYAAIFFMRKSDGYTGRYAAVNPPVDSGEMVIKELVFEGGQVTMVSGNVQQKVKYKIEGNRFTIMTKFGDFSYRFEPGESQFTLDGVVYQKK